MKNGVFFPHFQTCLWSLLLFYYNLIVNEVVQMCWLLCRDSVSEKWKWKSLSCVLLFVTPWTIQSLEFSRPEYWSGWPFPSPGDLPYPGIKPRSPELQANSLPAEPQGKPKNTGVGSLSLLQWIFPTQESNWGLLHCRRILYQLSYAARDSVKVTLKIAFQLGTNETSIKA